MVTSRCPRERFILICRHAINRKTPSMTAWRKSTSLGRSITMECPQSLVLRKLWERADHFHDMTAFWRDVAGDEGSFPQYSFIEPCYRGAAENDQHPPADVMNGEALIAKVYNAFRGN